jgi:hypothetical protein
VNSHLKVSGGTRLSMAYPTADPWRLAMWTAFVGDLQSKLSKADPFTLIHPTSSALSQAQKNVQLCSMSSMSSMFSIVQLHFAPARRWDIMGHWFCKFVHGVPHVSHVCPKVVIRPNDHIYCSRPFSSLAHDAHV